MYQMPQKNINTNDNRVSDWDQERMIYYGGKNNI